MLLQLGFAAARFAAVYYLVGKIIKTSDKVDSIEKQLTKTRD